MVDQNVSKRKATGSHFTPYGLAKFVAERILATGIVDFREPTVALDPACGDGELLLALAEELSPQERAKLDLIGIDTSKDAFDSARSRLDGVGTRMIDLRLTDFLEACEQELSGSQHNGSNLLESADVIIANPPYVRTQVLGGQKAQELARTFGLTGRVDLYQAFLIAMTHCLKPGGVLGVITSNRFISTKGGASLRKFLGDAYDVIELIDLGDTKLFEAAVLPAVFIGIRKQQELFYSEQQARFLKIYETTSTKLNGNVSEVDNVYACLHRGAQGVYRVNGKHFEISTGTMEIPIDAKDPWVLVSDLERQWVDKIHDCTWKLIQDITKVRVGIKTTADQVFIRQDWQELPSEIRPEDELLLAMYSNEDAGRWVPTTERADLKRVLYTHEIRNGKRTAIDLDQYPYAAAYFQAHYERLAGRNYVIKANRNWYEIWVPQDPSAWSAPKLVFPDISSAPRFFYDDTGAVVDGNCYWITLGDEHTDQNLLFLMLGVSNTKMMTRYHDLVFNNKLYAGRRRYLTQYVEKYPLPDPTLTASRQIISIAKQLSTEIMDEDKRNELEWSLEAATAEAFEIESIMD